MSLKCCLRVTYPINTYLLYLCPCIELGLLMLYLCDLLFFIFISFRYDWSYNLMNKDTLVLLLIFSKMPYYPWLITWMKNANNIQISKVQSHCLGFAWIFANFKLALLIKVLLLIKRSVYLNVICGFNIDRGCNEITVNQMT